eukprot:108644_1
MAEQESKEVDDKSTAHAASIIIDGKPKVISNSTLEWQLHQDEDKFFYFTTEYDNKGVKVSGKIEWKKLGKSGEIKTGVVTLKKPLKDEYSEPFDYDAHTKFTLRNDGDAYHLIFSYYIEHQKDLLGPHKLYGPYYSQPMKVYPQ